MRQHPAFVKYLISTTVALAAATAYAAPSSTSAYLQARDQVLAAMQTASHGHAAPEAMDAIAARAAPRLKQMLVALVGPFDMPGFAPQAMQWGSPVNPTLDGDVPLDHLFITSRDGKTSALLSTIPLWDSWVRSRRKDGTGFSLSADVTQALTRADFYNETFGEQYEAAAYKFGELPVDVHGLHASAGAILLSHGQDDVAPNPPTLIGIAVVRDDRLIVMEQEATVAPIPACKAAYQRHPESDDSEADFEHCFAQKLSAQGDYPALVRQAQALVDQALGYKGPHE